MTDEQAEAKIIPFPRQLRVVSIEDEADALPIRADVIPAAMEHDGRAYDLEAMVRLLLPHCVREVEAIALR